MKLIDKLTGYLERKSMWTSTYGLARSILALGTLLTFATNSTEILFKQTSLHATYCDPLSLSLYCLFTDLVFGKVFSIAILCLVVIGWRPAVTGILHAWVMYGFINSAVVIDGGDHIAAIVTTLLIPMTLTDNRKWHWQIKTFDKNTWFGLKSLFALSSIVAIRLQVSIIYLNSAAAKLMVPEWMEGTALYYWFKNPLFGSPSWLSFLTDPILLNGATVFILSWGVIIFEFLLFSGLLMSKKFKKTFFMLGIAFHLGIFIIHGLASFFFTMCACLILYLGPIHAEIQWPDFFNKFKYILYGFISCGRTGNFSRWTDN